MRKIISIVTAMILIVLTIGGCTKTNSDNSSSKPDSPVSSNPIVNTNDTSNPVVNSSLNMYFKSSVRDLLSNQKDENTVYSPANIMMNLSLLCEISDGDSRSQILRYLGCKDLNALREQVKSMWRYNNIDKDKIKCKLANSLWINQDIKVNQEMLDSLLSTNHADSFTGKMGSDKFNSKIKDWMNEQTNNLLSDSVDKLEFSPQTYLALVSTMYFKDMWHDKFEKNATTTGVFHGVNGDVKADFMNRNTADRHYYGDNYTAVSQRFESLGSMWFFLPNDGVSADSLIENPTFLDTCITKEGFSQSKSASINLSIPKFDAASDFELTDVLKKIGITDIFDSNKSDFTPLLSNKENVYVSEVRHAARVKIDEDGCEAAAYTEDQLMGFCQPEEEVNFVLDRPFIFVIASGDYTPLFVGVIRKP